MLLLLSYLHEGLKGILSSWLGHWAGAPDAQGVISPSVKVATCLPLGSSVSSLCLSFHEQKEDNKQLHLIKMVYHRAHQVS